MTTPHISAEPGDFAPVVLMPGDPLRARYIAENHLDRAQLVTSVRNMEGYTGTYRDQPVSVMGSGMGIPSLSIYATELVRDFGVQSLIRVGSCGAIAGDVEIRDIILAIGACTDSGVNRTRIRGYDFAAVADFDLLRAAADAAARLDHAVRVGNIFSTDLFYSPDDSIYATLAGLGVLAVEMEAAGLYGIAAAEGARALTICTVSDHLIAGTHLTPEERQSSFDEMMQVALEAAIAV
jgi:purine-nucleoside phosphorylase